MDYILFNIISLYDDTDDTYIEKPEQNDTKLDITMIS